MTAAPDAPDALPPVILPLTEYERIALLTTAMGLTQEAACHRLGISSRTLRRRLADAIEGLGARSVAHAVALAAASDQLDLDAVRRRELPRWRWQDRRGTASSRSERYVMKRRRFLRLLDGGLSVADAAAATGIASSTGYAWRAEHQHRPGGNRRRRS